MTFSDFISIVSVIGVLNVSLGMSKASEVLGMLQDLERCRKKTALVCWKIKVSA
jgi:hypothetical protein